MPRSGSSPNIVAVAALCGLPGCDGALDPMPAGGVGVPSLMACDPVRTWPAEAIELESALAERLAEVRRRGHDCGEAGTFEPAPALQRNGALVCAARLHSLDMADREFVDHENPDELTPWDRMRAVEYGFDTADEVIAAGRLSADEAFDDAWLARDGSCAAMMSSPYRDFGLGVHVDEASAHGRYFTLLLGKPSTR